jgi:hypothetical protein
MDHTKKSIIMEGLKDHSLIACLILNSLDKLNEGNHKYQNVNNPAYKHHIRGAIRSATCNVVGCESSDSKKRAHYMSKAAKQQMLSGKMDELMGEHVVPVSLINAKVVELYQSKKKIGKEIEVHEIIKIVKDWSVHAVITKKEDSKLKEAKLTKKMPPDWDRKNVFARHDKVGIVLIPNEYAALIKKKKKKN